ncbi:hypothetical protein MACJ_000892 [Theileria orientalis]|uniref:Uncharacterized protein n=1 Tax=Theileria orientalis TaxID=68886 RepID=A0A976M4W0_THEOR|nr:hypothetical protein MACJ_000892 [Theileria orientalis]
MKSYSGDSNGQITFNPTSQNNKVHSSRNRVHISNRGSEENGRALSTYRTPLKGSSYHQRNSCRPNPENSERHQENPRKQHLNSENHHRETKLNGVVKEERATPESRTITNHTPAISNSFVLSEDCRKYEDDIGRLLHILSTGKSRSVMAVAKSLLRAVSEVQNTFHKTWILNVTPANSSNAAELNHNNGSHEIVDKVEFSILSRINDESNKIVTFYRYRELENYLEIFHSQEIPPVNRKYNDEELEEQLEILFSNINLRLQSITRYLYFLKSNSEDNIREVTEYHNRTGMVNEIASHNELSQIVPNLLQRSQSVDKLISLASSHNFIIYRLIFVITKIRNKFVRVSLFRKELDHLDVVVRLMADHCNLSRVLTIMEFKNDDMISLLGKLSVNARDTGAVLEWIISIRLEDYRQTYQMSVTTYSTDRTTREGNNVEYPAAFEEVQNEEVHPDDDFELIVDDPVEAEPLHVASTNVNNAHETINSVNYDTSDHMNDPSSDHLMVLMLLTGQEFAGLDSSSVEISSHSGQNEADANSVSFQDPEISVVDTAVHTHSVCEEQEIMDAAIVELSEASEPVNQRGDQTTLNNKRLGRSGNGMTRNHNGRGGKKSKAKNKAKGKKTVRTLVRVNSGQDGAMNSVMETNIYSQLIGQTSQAVPSECVEATDMPSGINDQGSISEGASDNVSPLGGVKTEVADRIDVDETPSTSASDQVRGAAPSTDEESSKDTERTPESDENQLSDVQPNRREPLSSDTISDVGSNVSSNGSTRRSTISSLSRNPSPESSLTSGRSTNSESQPQRVPPRQENSSTSPNGRRDRTSRENRAREQSSKSTETRAGQNRDRAARERQAPEPTPERLNNSEPVLNGYLYLQKVFKAKSVEPHTAVLNLLKLLNTQMGRNELSRNPIGDASVRHVLKTLERLEKNITATSWQLSSIAESIKVLEASTRNIILGQDEDGQIGKESKKLVCGMLHEWDSVSTRLHEVATESVKVNNTIESKNLRSDHLTRKLGHINNLLDCLMDNRSECIRKLKILSRRLVKMGSQPTAQPNGPDNNVDNHTSEETIDQVEAVPLTPDPNQRVLELLNFCLKEQMRSREMELEALYNGVNSIYI